MAGKTLAMFWIQSCNGMNNGTGAEIMGNFTDREARMLRQRREELNLSQLEVASEAYISIQSYQRYEYGVVKLSNANMKQGLRICAALEIDPYELVFENGVDIAGIKKRKSDRKKA